MKILIVDDESDARKFLRVIAERAFHQVTEAENGQEGLRLAAEQKPDLIISDALMPVMDGFYFLREIKKDGPLKHIPFIFYSATYTGQDDIKLALALGADAYIIKPKEPEELWTEIGLALERSKKEKRPAQDPTASENEKEQLRQHAQVVALKLEQTVIKLRETLTALKRDDLEIQKLNRDLIDKNEEMENFLYITTHNLRTPLVNIQGFSQNLERHSKELLETLTDTPLQPEIKDRLGKLAGELIPDALKFISDSALKIDSLITALLKVSRVGRVEMKPETLEMNALLKKVIDSIHYQLDLAGGKVNLGNLPPCMADQAAVAQIFTNLLDNAVKYRHHDRPLVVNVTGAVKEGMAVYTVADNGSGIPAADIYKIWDLFYQPVRGDERKGEGVGLSIVKRLTKKNGGDIRVESKEGEGSVFYVALPLPL